MMPDQREQMHILCQRLAVEHDRKKFIEYSDQMRELLERKRILLETRDFLASSLSGLLGDSKQTH
jgi:hypothetical protein